MSGWLHPAALSAAMRSPTDIGPGDRQGRPPPSGGVTSAVHSLFWPVTS